MRFIFRCLVVFSLAALEVWAKSESKGKVVEKVICAADESQSYALYLPSTYTTGKKWPVIFCFDASAHGLVPVERLRVAAEKYGYIVAGSLTSRNGPWAANATAARAMIRDVSVHFVIDPQQVYTAGVSGGARVATGLALSGLAKGVIACSAGFPVPDTIPKQVPFAFFGTAGTEDFNYWEMRHLDEELERRHTRHRLIVFNGGHEWASSLLMMEAVEWLELEAMKSGSRQKNGKFVDDLLKQRITALPDRRGLERLRSLKSLVADFSGLTEVKVFEREVEELSNSSEVKTELKLERAWERRESELADKLGEIALESTTRKQKFSVELHERENALEDTEERRVVRRAMATYVSMTRARVQGLFEEKEYGRASSMLELAVILRPGEKQVTFDLARSHGFDGDKKRAIESLNQAVGAGFNDLGRIETDPAFAKLASDAGFQDLLARVRASHFESTLEMPVMRVSAALASVELRVFSQPNVDSATQSLSFLRVENVRLETAAARAGIVPDMEIVAIQGVRIRGLTEEELGDTMNLAVQKEIVLVVREPPRKGEREIRIPLRKTSSGAASPANEIKEDLAAVAK